MKKWIFLLSTFWIAGCSLGFATTGVTAHAGILHKDTQLEQFNQLRNMIRLEQAPAQQTNIRYGLFGNHSAVLPPDDFNSPEFVQWVCSDRDSVPTEYRPLCRRFSRYQRKGEILLPRMPMESVRRVRSSRAQRFY